MSTVTEPAGLRVAIEHPKPCRFFRSDVSAIIGLADLIGAA